MQSVGCDRPGVGRRRRLRLLRASPLCCVCESYSVLFDLIILMNAPQMQIRRAYMDTILHGRGRQLARLSPSRPVIIPKQEV
jgi:hypothetical protein